jgi:putative membrane protein insertion efficiency factor
MLRSLPARIAVVFVRVYQLTISPLFHSTCRFEPTCSHYAIDALRKHGLLHGALKTAWRVLRCNPWGGSGYDPA